MPQALDNLCGPGKPLDEVKRQSLEGADLFSYFFSSYLRTFHVV